MPKEDGLRVIRVFTDLVILLIGKKEHIDYTSKEEIIR